VSENSQANAAGEMLNAAAAMFTATTPVAKDSCLRCGVDLGTASIILVVLDEAGRPVACEMRPAQVARDGLVVDYIGAIEITRALVEKLERRLGRKLEHAAIAVPPGTTRADSGTHRHVVEAAGMEVGAVLDEPTAANAVLGIENGVVVDIGGGTTGLAVFRDGRVVYEADEATGGTHMSLVLMGRYKLDFEGAEAFKQDAARRDEVCAAVLPVMEKMAGIVKRHIGRFDVGEAWLVGGTSCLSGIEDVFTRVLGIQTFKPPHPMMVTPLGIALNCACPQGGQQ
jgi:ethanolamine utilization protein EutJ